MRASTGERFARIHGTFCTETSTAPLACAYSGSFWMEIAIQAPSLHASYYLGDSVAGVK